MYINDEKQAKPDFSRIFQIAELLPCRVDEEENLVSFMRMSESAYRDSSFLDRRAKVDQYFSTSIDSILKKYNSIRSQLFSQPTHLVLYNGYCGSTLLSRLLHELPGCHVTKEPVITYWLSDAKINARTQGSLAKMDLVGMLYFMLTRRWMSNKGMFIKIPSVNMILAEDLLSLNPANTAIYLYAGRKEFLSSYLKKEQRRHEAHRFYETLINYVRKTNLLGLPLPDSNAGILSDTHCVAALWIIYSSLYTRLISRFTSNRIYCCESQAFFRTPEQVLKTMTEKVRVQVANDEISTATSGGVSRTYSKNPDKEYSLDIRLAELKEQYTKNKSEIDEGMLFIESYEERMGQPFHHRNELC